MSEQRPEPVVATWAQQLRAELVAAAERRVDLAPRRLRCPHRPPAEEQGRS